MSTNTLKIYNTAHLVDLAVLPEYKDFSVMDLSLAVNRLKADHNPLDFISGLRLPVVIKNIDCAPEVVVSLVESDLDLEEIVGCCSQNYNLKIACERTDIYSRVSFIDVVIRDKEIQEEKVFAPAPEFINNLLVTAADARRKTNILESIVKGWIFNGDQEKIAAYVAEVISTDIIGKTTASDELKFYRFMSAVANMTGTVMNYTTLANNVGVTGPTAKIWLKFLEGTGLVYLVEPIEDVPGKRLMKAPKVYFRDTGICAYLLQIKDTNELIQSIQYKKLFDNFVMNLIRESYIENKEEISWRFYRDSNAKEISAIIKRDNVIYPLIISLEKMTAKKLSKSFAIVREYCEEKNLEMDTGSLITLGKDTGILSREEGLVQINAGDLLK